MEWSTPGIPHRAAGCTPLFPAVLVKKCAPGAPSGLMIERIRESWRHFKASEPGHRFKDSYHRRRRSGGRFDARRVVNITLGSVLVVGSAFFGWAPGPGLVTFFLGLALISGELYPVARLLDWSEMRLRELARWAGRIWASASPAGRTLIVAALATCTLALAYGAYSLLFA